MTYLSVAETAVIMGLKPRTVRAHCRKGRLPHIRNGRDYYIDADDARAFEKRPSGRPTEEEREKRIVRDEQYLARRATVRADREAAMDHG